MRDLAHNVAKAHDPVTMDLTGALGEWVLAMRGANRSKRTIEARELIISNFARTCDPMTCRWQDIAAWLGTEGWQRGTVRTYFDALRAWFGWLVVVGYRTDNPTAPLPKPPARRGVPRPITTAELAVILDSVNRRRTRGLILLCAFQGLRIHEAAKMRGEYIRGSQLRVIGKGDSDDLIPLHEVIKAEARSYPRIGLWFPSYTDCHVPITAKNASRVVSETMHRAGVDASAHCLRHWTATSMLEEGADIRTVQEVMRHLSLASTAIYTKVNDTKRRAAVDSLPVPLAVCR